MWQFLLEWLHGKHKMPMKPWMGWSWRACPKYGIVVFKSWNLVLRLMLLVSDIPPETWECNLGIEDIHHFLFECPFYAIRRVTLAVNGIDILQRKNLSHLGNKSELYLYEDLSLDPIDNRQILLSTIICKRYHAILNFSYVRLTPIPNPVHTPSTPVTIVFDLYYLLLYSCFFL